MTMQLDDIRKMIDEQRAEEGPNRFGLSLKDTDLARLGRHMNSRQLALADRLGSSDPVVAYPWHIKALDKIGEGSTRYTCSEDKYSSFIGLEKAGIVCPIRSAKREDVIIGGGRNFAITYIVGIKAPTRLKDAYKFGAHYFPIRGSSLVQPYNEANISQLLDDFDTSVLLFQGRPNSPELPAGRRILEIMEMLKGGATYEKSVNGNFNIQEVLGRYHANGILSVETIPNGEETRLYVTKGPHFDKTLIVGARPPEYCLFARHNPEYYRFDQHTRAEK